MFADSIVPSLDWSSVSPRERNHLFGLIFNRLMSLDAIDIDEIPQYTSSSPIPRSSQEKPIMGLHPKRVAVIGAGVSGLTSARHLSESGLEVVVFERYRSPGGNW